MKLPLLATALTAGALALGTAVTVNQPSQAQNVLRVRVSGSDQGGVTVNQLSQAQSTVFFCGTSGDGTPTTLARTRRGTVEVIRWVSQHFSGSGYSPQKRCQDVSSRFENYKNKGILNFITAGYLNGQPAICVGDGSSPCSSDRLLFTLKPGQSAAREIQQLFNIRAGASGPLYESTRASGSGSSVIDMNKFLESARVVDTGVSADSAQPETTAPATSQPSSPVGGEGTLW